MKNLTANELSIQALAATKDWLETAQSIVELIAIPGKLSNRGVAGLISVNRLMFSNEPIILQKFKDQEFDEAFRAEAVAALNRSIATYEEMVPVLEKLTPPGMQPRELKLSEDTWDYKNMFRVAGVRSDCSLHRDKIKTGDGIYWVMQHGAMLKSNYSAAEVLHTARMNKMKPLHQGEVVLIDGEKYKIKIAGDYSDCAVFEKLTYSELLAAAALDRLGYELTPNSLEDLEVFYVSGEFTDYEVCVEEWAGLTAEHIEAECSGVNPAGERY